MEGIEDREERRRRLHREAQRRYYELTGRYTNTERCKAYRDAHPEQMRTYYRHWNLKTRRKQQRRESEGNPARER